MVINDLAKLITESNGKDWTLEDELGVINNVVRILRALNSKKPLPPAFIAQY